MEITLKPTVDKVVKGVLALERDKPFVENAEGEKHFHAERIWNGYVQHWTGTVVRARRLPQLDYESDQPIVLLAPDVCWPTARPYVALYYNERLVGEVASLFGHIAIDVNGTVFNFSHLLNEDEMLTLDEFLYRPSLGEFSPHPDTGGFNIDDPTRPYFSKFGRLFMRSVHALVVEGLDTDAAMQIFQSEMQAVHSAPVDPSRPEYYQDFSFTRRSCATIVRDGLKRLGLRKIEGIFPRDLYVSAAHCLFEEQRKGHLSVTIRALSQLKVAERPYSAMTPLFNPANRFRAYKLRRDFRATV